MKIKIQKKKIHAKASQRRRRNRIQEIKNMDGNWVEEKEDIVEVAINYFDSLFSADACSQMDECLNTVLHKVTPDMQHILSSEFTADEIKIALFQMELTKGKCWHVMGDSVNVVVLDYLNSGLMVPKINHTNIVLVPKVKSLEKMSDFRSISLCNVIYKIISKVLANRLK